jgi:regulator of protease activity HflC (stomatin/prohibitin superfamily)
MKTINYFNPISITLLIVFSAILTGLYLFRIIGIPLFAGGIILSVLLASSIHIADQWEKAVVLRMGKFTGLKGPGPFMIIPILDRVNKYIDQRVRVNEIKAEQTLTKDTVPVNVDAVVYWTVWDVEKAALEVQDYAKAIAYIAQTGLRDTIGKHDLADLLSDREKISSELQTILDEHTNPWGITCQTVRIQELLFPEGVSDSMLIQLRPKGSSRRE